jgi:hypothetical protein
MRKKRVALDAGEPYITNGKEPTMFIGLTQARISLDTHHGISPLTHAAGAAVKVLAGHVWLTMDGDHRDIFLPSGDAHTIERDGLTLVHAIEPSVVEVQEPRASPGRFKQWLARAWDWLVEAGEARVRARIERGVYHF